MPQPAYGQLSATSPSSPAAPSRHRSGGALIRLARLSLIGLLVLPFVLSDQIGLAASTQSVTVVASADAQVRSHFPTRNYGAGPRLRTKIRVGDQQRTLLRFNVPKLSGPVTAVRLQLWVRDASVRGGSVHPIAGSWSEGKVTWETAPALASTVLGQDRRHRQAGPLAHGPAHPVEHQVGQEGRAGDRRLEPRRRAVRQPRDRARTAPDPDRRLDARPRPRSRRTGSDGNAGSDGDAGSDRHSGSQRDPGSDGNAGSDGHAPADASADGRPR